MSSPSTPQTSRWPSGPEPWLSDPDRSLSEGTSGEALGRHLQSLPGRECWTWPDKPVYFISDIHADAVALLESLEMVGLINRTGPRLRDFAITRAGKDASVIVGGDCLDKGPSNLKLLNTLKRLRRRGLDLLLLAGNHDLRLALGLACLTGPLDARTEHLFLRMGNKTMPLLYEIWQRRLKNKSNALAGVPDKKSCLDRLLPKTDWPERFRAAMANRVPTGALDREISRILEKRQVFKSTYKSSGIGIRQVYAAAEEARRMFLVPGGKYAWFLPELQVAARRGSFLFVHAGVDDVVASQLSQGSLDQLNESFRREFARDPFACYAGPLGNTMRTKYRPVDYPLSSEGSSMLSKSGIYAVVHGHRSNHCGQRLALRCGVLHIECDITLDRNTRHKEGLADPGAGITVIQPEGCVWGISTDHPRVKVFNPSDFSPTERLAS